MVAPTIYAVTPNLEAAAGGTVAEVIGRDFDFTGTVTVGGAPPLPFRFVSQFLLQLTCPPLAAGPRDVVVSTSGGTATAVGAIRYI